MALKKMNTAMKEEIRMMKEENRRIEEEKLVEKRLNKGMKVEIDTKKEETRLTNPERQMKHENRLSLFLTDSYGKIIDFQKIKEELGCTLVRGKTYNSATWPFSMFPEENLKRLLEDKMKEPFTDLIIQQSANDISNLQFLDDQDLKLKMAAKSTRNSVNVVKAAFLQNRNLRNMLILPRSPAGIQLY